MIGRIWHESLGAIAFVTVVLTLLATVAGAVTPEQHCQAAKNKAAGKKAACMANEHAKEVKGRTPDYSKCSQKFLAAFVKAETKAANRGSSCPTTGDADLVGAQIDAMFDSASGIASMLSGVRFVDNGDGTVTDTHTCLTWEKKDNLDEVVDPNNPHDADNKYTWGTPTAASGTVFSDFLYRLNYCVSNGVDPISGGFSGHCDWRLPSLFELQTIQGTLPGAVPPFPCDSSLVCIDPIFGPTQPGATSFDGYYLTSTTLSFGGSLGHLFAVQFRGPIGTSSWEEHVPSYVRAVRGIRCDADA